jgi:hypothetical protein
MALQAKEHKLMMYSKEELATAARAKGHTEEQVQRIIGAVAKLKQAGLVKTSSRAYFVGLTVEGRRMLADLRAQGKIPSKTR